MYEHLDLLRQSPIVLRLDIFNFVDEEDIQIFNVKATIRDGSVLFIRELITTTINHPQLL
jgi:hypothetical protein